MLKLEVMIMRVSGWGRVKEKMIRSEVVEELVFLCRCGR